MTEWIVSSGVLILVVALVRQLFRGRMSLRLQYALWLLVLVRLLVPVSFGQSRISVLNAVEERQTAQITVDIPPSRGDYVAPDLAPVEPDPELPVEEQHRQNGQQWQDQMDAAWEQYKAENTREVTVSVPGILRIVWYAGMAAVALCLLFSNLSFWLRLRRSRRRLEGADCPLPVYVTGAAETPCLFGLLRPAVYVTPEAAGDALTMGHVLAHEYTHFRHGDHIWSLLRCLCLVLHWYNPLVWLAASLSRRDGELACDEGTLRRIGEGERLAYGRTLIALTCTRRGGLLRTATTMTGGKGSIKERITLIAKKPRMAVYTLIAVLLIAALAVGCTFTGAKEEAAEPPAASESVTPADPDDEQTGLGQTLAELGEGGDPLSLTLYTAGHGAWETVDITYDRVSGIFDGPVGTGTPVEFPSTAPSDYWLTLVSADGKRSMTLWSGEEGLVQYSDESGTRYWSLGGGEYCATLLRQRYNQRVQSPDQLVFYAQNAEMAAERFPLLFCQMHMEYPTGHLFRSADYRLLGSEIEEFSADGNAVSGQMKCALLLESDLDIYPKDRVYQYQGWVIYNVRFSLGLGEDGLWHGVDWSVDFISFEEYGYEVGDRFSGRGIMLEDAAAGPQEAINEFALAYGAKLMSTSGHITDYEVGWCEPREISIDGDAVIGFFRCLARLSGSGELMALNGWKETDDGRWAFGTLFLLERDGGTGRWYCSQWEDIGELADYGYEDGMISAVMGNPEVYRCDGDDPYEAALTLMTAYVEELMIPLEMRSFTITEYRNLSVTLTPTLELSEAERYNYVLLDGEIGENIWIVELRMEYRWEGALYDPPYGPSKGHEDHWIDIVHQGSPRGFLLTRNGNEFTLQSRY